jgi:hypothetical protein
MKDTHDNILRLKSIISKLGDQWDHDRPTRPASYEGTEHLIVFTYCMAENWKEFFELLGEWKKELDEIIQNE